MVLAVDFTATMMLSLCMNPACSCIGCEVVGEVDETEVVVDVVVPLDNSSLRSGD